MVDLILPIMDSKIMDFMVVQKEIEVHFIGLLLAATLFTVGIILYIYNFIQFGIPTDEVLMPEGAHDELEFLNDEKV